MRLSGRRAPRICTLLARPRVAHGDWSTPCSSKKSVIQAGRFTVEAGQREIEAGEYSEGSRLLKSTPDLRQKFKAVKLNAEYVLCTQRACGFVCVCLIVAVAVPTIFTTCCSTNRDTTTIIKHPPPRAFLCHARATTHMRAPQICGRQSERSTLPCLWSSQVPRRH